MVIAFSGTPVNASAASTAGERFGGAVATWLSAAADALPDEHLARLERARRRALERRKQVLTASARFAKPRTPFWLRLNSRGVKVAAVAPLLVMVAGLCVIDRITTDRWVNEMAEVEVKLLISKLPLSAYTDPGFAEFVRRQRSLGGDACAKAVVPCQTETQAVTSM